MVKLEFTDHFNYDVEKVFTTFRDRLDEYTKYVPNLTSCKIKEKKQIDKNKVRIKAEWKGHGQIPFLIRAILRPDMISWSDECIWDEKEYTCSWKITPHYFKEFFQCEGKWQFSPDGKNKTKIKLDGFLKIYIPHFPGVPDVIARAAGGVIESFLMKYLKPNLIENNKAIRKFLTEEESCERKRRK